MTATYLDYARRGANAWWRYALASALGLTLTIVLGAAVIAVGELLRIFPSNLAATIQHPDEPATFFLITGVIFGILLLGFILAIRWIHHKRARDVVGAWNWRQYLWGFAIWVAAAAAAALIDFAIAPSGFSIAAKPQASILAAALAGLAIQTFAEEFIFRGYLTQGLMLAIKRPLPAAVVSGLIFGALHIPNGAPQAASAAVFGAILSLIAIRTGGVAFTSGLHLANNLFAAVILVSSGDAFQGSPGLFVQDTPQLMWWDAGLGSAALMVVAFFVLRRNASEGERTEFR